MRGYKGNIQTNKANSDYSQTYGNITLKNTFNRIQIFPVRNLDKVNQC